MTKMVNANASCHVTAPKKRVRVRAARSAGQGTMTTVPLALLAPLHASKAGKCVVARRRRSKRKLAVPARPPNSEWGLSGFNQREGTATSVADGSLYSAHACRAGETRNEHTAMQDRPHNTHIRIN